MKTNLLKNLKWALLSVTLCSTLFMYAGAGFWNDRSATLYFSTNGGDKEYDVKKSGQGNIDMGTVSSLTFKSFIARVWKDGSGNICGDDFKLYYRVYLSSSPTGSFTDVKANWKSESGTNQEWGNDVNVDLLSGKGNDNYTLEFYIFTKGSESSSSDCSQDFTLNNNNPDGNYKFTFRKGGATDCDVQAKGASIPANTIIFYDNSDKLFSGEIWLSVPTESGNGNASNVNQGSYYRNKDKWYQMRKVEGDIWKATITTASSYGRMSFWNKDGHDADDVWQNTVVFQAPYTTGKNIYKPDASKKCYNSDRQTDVYFKGTWGLRTGLFLNLSSTDRKIDDTNPITLKAEVIGVTGTDYTFEYRAFDADTWETLATQSSPEYILSGTKLPVKSTYYRVKYGTATSPEVRLAVLINCDEGGSAKNILKYDFGTLTELKGTNSRTSSSDMAKDYEYKAYPNKINDGHYAVVATPYYCGCGDGSVDEPVTACEGNNMWFRDIKDHTLGDKGTAGNYGGMLMINFSDAKSKTAYEHELTSTEKAAFVKGSTLSFSAYFASAAKAEADSVKINMKLMIQYKAVGSEEWVTKAELENKVEYNDNWKFGNTSIDIDDPAGDYRVVIENYSAAGTGNDALIDDISLDLCVPTFPVSFYDEATDSEYDTYTYKQMDETQIIRISKQDYGHGEQNCVVLLSVDDSKKAGEAGRYELIDVMNLTSYKGADYYSTTKSVNELLGGNVGIGKLQALVTKPEICSDPTKLEDLKTKLYNGDIKPLDSADYMFSTNLLTYNIGCNTTITAAFEGNTSVCEEGGKKEENDLPTLNVTFGSIASYVYYSISEDGNAIVSDEALSAAEITAGKFSVDLNALDQTKIIRTPGTHTFKVDMYEYAEAPSPTHVSVKLCEKSASITLTVVNKPNGTLEQLVTKCDGVEKSVSVTAHYADKYQWQINTSPATAVAANWTDIPGATSADYTIPKDAADGSQYRVGLSNSDGYCEAQYSNEITLKVEKCDDVSLTLSPAAKSICKGEEIEFTASLTNLGSIPANVSVTEDIAKMNNFEPISATPSQGTFSGNVWTITDFAQGASATLVLKYKAKADVEVSGTEKVYVSRLGESIWGSYDEQTDNNMKASSVISAKEVTDMPTLSDPYDECQKLGVKELSDFVTSDKSDLRWYSDAELKNEVNPAVFDMNVPTPEPTPTTHGTMYYVTNQESGKCVSYPAAQSVTVRKAPAPIVTKDFIKCTNDKKLDLQTLVTNYDAENIYSYYYDGVILNDKVIDLESGASKTYSVQAVLGECESNMADMTVSVKAPVTSVLLKEKDDVDEYDLDGVPTVKRALGTKTEKILTITPADAPNYTLKWYVGDAEFDGLFPRSPYVDHVYKAVVVDECGNTLIAKAGTQVEWPTIFMPYDNGTNKDFVVGIDGGIEIYVFDRTGNMVAHSLDGWDGFANQNGNTKIAMPGLYYYKAILPDGSVKKGTVEVFKK